MLRKTVGSACAFVASFAAVHVMSAGQLQQPPKYTERVDVSSVVVDVRVIDEFGVPIRDLKASDFAVAIGGTPVRVQLSSWTGGALPAASASPAAAAASRQAPSPAAEEGQLVVLFFQKSLARGRARGFVRMVEQSRSLVRDLSPSDRVAIVLFETSLKVWTDFTADREALDRILVHGILHEPPPASVPEGTPSLVRGLTPAARRVANVERAFEAIADALRPLPGSKAIAFVGYGMGAMPFGSRLDLGPASARFGADATTLAGNSDMSRQFRRALKALTAARASVFSLDVTEADTHSLATGMQVIAAATGGFYASSLDFPEKPMRLLTGALHGHYVLFVEPPPEPYDRTITVGVTANRRAYVYSTSSFRSAEP